MKVIATKSKFETTIHVDDTDWVLEIEDGNECLAVFGSAENEAKHVAKCVNCHDELLKALITARKQMLKGGITIDIADAYNTIYNAIKKATE